MIQLQKFEEKDFETFKSWIKGENQLLQFAGSIFTFPIENSQLLAYINDSKRISLKVVLIDSNEMVGHCELNFENKLPRLSRILIGKEELRNKGYGKLIINEMLKLMFDKYSASVGTPTLTPKTAVVVPAANHQLILNFILHYNVITYPIHLFPHSKTWYLNTCIAQAVYISLR